MKDARPLVLLLIFMFTAIAGMYVAASSCVPLTPPQATVVAVGDPLTEALKSGVTIRQNYFGGSGTGVLIGREKLENGNWRYAVLTAYHVIDHIREAVKAKPDEADAIKSLTIVYQEHFHAPLTLVETTIIDFDWTIPNQDWAIFRIDLPVKLPCVEMATRKEFESIQPYDNTYGLGSDGSDGLFLREGIVASTNGTQPFISAFGYQYPWDYNQDDFFRVYHGIYYGASGGPVFTRQGKLIGIYNGYVQMHEGQPVTNLAVALKVHLVREALERVQSTIANVEN